MNIFKRFYCRVFQKTIYCFTFLLNFREPKIIDGQNAVSKIPEVLKNCHKFRPLIVTDKGIHSLGLDKKITKALDDAGFKHSLYSDVVPNPTFDVIEAALEIYKKDNCDCIIALGGGSSMDAAKSVGARVVNPNKELSRFKGVLKVRKQLPLLIAIPTTAGTGSESTAVAVIVNPVNHDKFTIDDTKLIPHFAVLDDSLLEALPQNVIAYTGMDTLTHAIEAYIGKASTKKCSRYALESLKLISENLLDFYKDSKNHKARANMQKAAYLAGVAFTRCYVGYCHALSHAIGGLSNSAHGLINATLLPYVLEIYGSSTYEKLADIASAIGLGKRTDSAQSRAFALINYIKELNDKMGIPSKFDKEYSDKDIFALATRASKEANPLYPVPRLLDANDLATILRIAHK